MTGFGPVELLTLVVLFGGLYYQKRAVDLQYRQVETQLHDLQEVIARVDAESRARETIARDLEVTNVAQLNNHAAALNYTSELQEIKLGADRAVDRSHRVQEQFFVGQIMKIAAAVHDGDRKQAAEVADACAGYMAYLIGAAAANDRRDEIVDAANSRFAEALDEVRAHGVTGNLETKVAVRLKELREEGIRANAELAQALKHLQEEVPSLCTLIKAEREIT